MTPVSGGAHSARVAQPYSPLGALGFHGYAPCILGCPMRIDSVRLPIISTALALMVFACGGQIDGANGEPYQGRVLALSSVSYTDGVKDVFYDVQDSFQAAALAAPGEGPSQGCSCARGFGKPVVVSGEVGPPQPPPPTAGVLSVTTGAGTSLATLTPQQGEAYWTHATWSPGIDLSVTADGDTVDGFAGLLRTAALPVGVTPALGASPVRVDRTRDFELSWTPGQTVRTQCRSRS